MDIDEIRANAPEGATHYKKYEYGYSYYFYSNQVKRWFYYDKYHNYWFSIRDPYFEDRFEPL